jgi:hypothetical protein
VSSARYVAWLVARRLRRRDSGALVTALGLTAATAVLAVVLAGATIASDRATSQAVERIPTTARSLRATWFGVPANAAERHAALDREVRAVLGDIARDGPTPIALFRESTVAGRFVGLAAVDGLAPHVILRSGRLPRRCSPRHCEVLRLRGRGALPNAPGLRLVEVGTATLRSRQLFGDFLQPTDNATADAQAAPALRESGRYHRPAPAPLVVAEGIEALVSSPAVARTYRTYAWVWPLAAGTPRLWEVDGLIGRVERARAELAGYSGSFAVSIPEEELRSAQRRAEVAGRRLLIVGGEVAALLLAFALLAARGLRRDLEATRTRLIWYGARRWQLALLTGLESAAVAGVSVLAGWLLGSAAGASAAALAEAPAGSVLAESTLSPLGLGLALAAAAVTTTLTALVVSLRSRGPARAGAAEAVGVAAAIVIGVALLGGAVDEERLASSDDSATLLLLLPGLVALVAAVAVARLFRVVARLVADRSRGPLSSRLAALSLARSPGAAVVTVSFLTIAFGLAVLAEAYRATLVRSEREQAAFQVPLDVVVREDLGSLVRVFDAAPLERFQALAGSSGGAYPVLRVTGGAGRAERVTGVTVLGLERGAVEQLQVWRAEWADGAEREEVADRIAPGQGVRLRGVQLAGDELELTAGPSLLGFVAIVETPDGRFERVELGSAQADSSTRLTARVRPRSRLVSLELVPPPRLIEGGADAGVAFDGVVRLVGPVARELATWTGVDGATVRPSSAGVDVRFVLTPQRRSRLRAKQVTDETPPAVLVTPRLAELAGGADGTLPVQVGGALVPVRIAGVVERFPGTSGDVVVGDLGALRTAINTATPGAAVENEVWLAVAEDRRQTVSGALARPPFHVLAGSARADLEADARRDPLARATLLALGGAALLALLLAATGLALAVRADLRDERGELDELEAQGASPSLLRRVVRLRALALTVGGLIAGAVTGALLVTLVTRVVSVTARGGFAEPPLAATVEVAVVAVGLAGFVLLAAALVAVGTHRSFAGVRGPAFPEDR